MDGLPERPGEDDERAGGAGGDDTRSSGPQSPGPDGDAADARVDGAAAGDTPAATEGASEDDVKGAAPGDHGDEVAGDRGVRGEGDSPRGREERRRTGVYLSVYLARSGVGSRRYCDDVVKQGRVTIDGLVVTFPREQVGSGDEVAVDGDVVTPRELRYVLVNKPRGVASTRSDPHADRVLVELVPNGRVLFPVGRLDVDTTGLIVLTNDGVLANRLMHPRYGVPKTYAARVQGRVSKRELAELRRGVALEDGTTAPAEARLIKQSPKTALVELTLHEGRKRQVRRMLAALGLPVEELHRRRYGPLTDKGLAPGQHRDLTQEEIDALRRAGEESDRRVRSQDSEEELGPDTAVEG
jgi:23S rRNA pseudouridine2605 synthase